MAVELDRFSWTLKEIGSEFKSFTRKYHDRSLPMLHDWGNSLKRYMISSMKTTPKSDKTYKRGSKTHRPSRPQNPPAIDTGELVRSIHFDVRSANLQLEIGVMGGAPYSEHLEYRDHTNKRRPFLEPAMQANEQEMRKDFEDAFKLSIDRVFRKGGFK